MNRHAIVFLLAVLWSTCAAQRQQPILISARGATSAAPLYTEWIFGYSLVRPEAKFVYLPTGSSNGTASQIDGTADWAGSDVLASPAQVAAAQANNVELFYWPFVATGIVPLVNLGTEDQSLESQFVLDGPTLARIYTGAITRWNDARIAALNPSIAAQLPDADIVVVTRSDGSGTTEVWTQAMLAFVGPDEWPYGTGATWNQTLIAQLQPNVIQTRGSYGVLATLATLPFTIGYASYAFPLEAGIPYVQLINAAGDLTNVTDGVSLAIVNSNSNGFESLINLALPGAWPIATFTYGLLNRNLADVPDTVCSRTSELVRFVEWCLLESTPRQRAASSGYTQLPAELAGATVRSLTNMTCNGETVLPLRFVDQRQSAVWIVMLVLACVSCLVPILLLAVYLTKPERRSPSNVGLWYTLMTLGGSIVLMAAVVLFYLVPTNDAICGLQPWFVGLGLVFLVTPMLAKVFFLLLVASETNWSIFVRPATFLVQIALLIVWTSVDMYSSDVVVIDRYDLSARYECQSNSIWIWMGLEIAFFAAILLLGLVLTVLSYRSKSSEAQCAETNWIGFAIYNLTIFACILVPILAALDVSDEIRYFLICLGLIVPALGINLALYGKMVLEYFNIGQQRHSTTQDISHSSRDLM